MKKLLMFLCAVTLVLGSMGRASAYAFNDDFNRPDNNDIGPNWTQIENDPEDARIRYGTRLWLQDGAAAYTVDISTLGGSSVTIEYDWKGNPNALAPDALAVSWRIAADPWTTLAVHDLSNHASPLNHETFTMPQWGNQTAISFLFDVSSDRNNDAAIIDNVRVTVPNPEPTTVLLMGIGIVGLVGGAARKRLRKKAVVKS